MSPALKWSKRVCILFSFSFIRHLRGLVVAPDLKLWILFSHCLLSLDEFNPCIDVWVRLGDDFLYPGMPTFNIAVGSGHVLIKIVPVIWWEVSINPCGGEVVDKLQIACRKWWFEFRKLIAAYGQLKIAHDYLLDWKRDQTLQQHLWVTWTLCCMSVSLRWPKGNMPLEMYGHTAKCGLWTPA